MEPLRFKDHRTVLLLMGMLISLGPLSIDMYLPAFQKISTDFGVSISSVELSLSSFFIGLSDRFGRKKPLYFGLILYALASIGCALSTSIEALVALRFLQALGGCAGMVISRAMVRDLFNHKDSAKVFSMLMLIMGLAPILAPLVGGQLVSYYQWQSIFWLSSLLSVMCFLIILFRMPETAVAKSNMRILETFASYLDIFKDKEFLRNALAGGTLQAGMFAYITGSSFVFIDLFGVKPQHFGWFFGLNAAGFIFVSQINSRLVDRFGPERVLEFSLNISFLTSLALLCAALLNANFFIFGACLFLFMSSMGVVLPNSTAGALAAQGSRAGAASGLLGTMQFVFATFSSAFLSFAHATSALPMASIIAICGVSSLVLFKFLAPTTTSLQEA